MLPHTGLFLLGKVALQMRIRRRLKNKKQPAQPVFLAANLNPNSRPVLSPCGRELERGQQAERLVLGRLSCWERLPQLGKCRLPGPPLPRRRQWRACRRANLPDKTVFLRFYVPDSRFRGNGGPRRRLRIAENRFTMISAQG
ncbi:hypothetical protein CCD87_00365 [Neisseria meningitidis]|nr:hypothetical protein CCD87_00365 [Neisseria meningitidis]QGK42459.1 hypothetical protein GJE05_00305 [Neisseria meningitidis]